jgi:hypothetical protein
MSQIPDSNLLDSTSSLAELSNLASLESPMLKRETTIMPPPVKRKKLALTSDEEEFMEQQALGDSERRLTLRASSVFADPLRGVERHENWVCRLVPNQLRQFLIGVAGRFKALAVEVIALDTPLISGQMQRTTVVDIQVRFNQPLCLAEVYIISRGVWHPDRMLDTIVEVGDV